MTKACVFVLGPFVRKALHVYDVSTFSMDDHHMPPASHTSKRLEGSRCCSYTIRWVARVTRVQACGVLNAAAVYISLFRCHQHRLEEVDVGYGMSFPKLVETGTEGRAVFDTWW